MTPSLPHPLSPFGEEEAMVFLMQPSYIGFSWP
jgi:hypothetical protein